MDRTSEEEGTSCLQGADVGYFLPRHELTTLLADEIKKNHATNITVHNHTLVTSIQRGEDGRLTLCAETTDRAAPSAPSSRLSLSPRLVIAADGFRSTVRGTLESWYPKEGFERTHFESPAGGLRYKVFNASPGFPIKRFGIDETVASTVYVFPGTERDERHRLRIGFLPQNRQAAPRPCVVITRPGNAIWECESAEEVYAFLEKCVPHFPAREAVPHEEMERFARSTGSAFPVPQSVRCV